jgi:hypothetical protein
MSRPVDPHASAIEYAPTQFVAEHVRNEDYDGLMFVSALNAGGMNLVLFDKTDAEVVDVTLYRVRQVRYEAEKYVPF